MKKYIISPETFFDADIELYFTYILHDNSVKDFQQKHTHPVRWLGLKVIARELLKK